MSHNPICDVAKAQYRIDFCAEARRTVNADRSRCRSAAMRRSVRTW